MPGTFSVRGPMVIPTGYAGGPGDSATFAAWWGLRAYSSAQLSGTTASIDLHNTTTGVFDTTINILTTGSLDTATAAVRIAAGAAKVGKIYDQTGNGFHLTQATALNMPTLTIGASGLTAGRPSMAMAGAAFSQTLRNAGGFPGNHTQPYSMSTVCIRRADFTAVQHIVGVEGSFELIEYQITSGKAHIYSGTSGADVDAPNSTWCAMNALFSGAGGSLMVNGTPTAQSSGAVQISAAEPLFLCGSNGAAVTNGDVCEGGIIFTDASGNFTAINNNQRTYWGF